MAPTPGAGRSMTRPSSRPDILYSPVKGDAELQVQVQGTQLVSIITDDLPKAPKSADGVSKMPVFVVGGLGGGARRESMPRRPLRQRLPQVLACFSVQCFNLIVGLGMAYSSALIPALEAEDSEIPVTRQQSALLASVMTVTVPVGAFLAGWLMDALGRLNTIKLATIPYSTAWAIIGSAQSFEQLLAGRLLMGATFGIGTGTGLLYIAEVAEKDLRGTFSCFGTALASLGVLLGYVAGACLDWRTTAWVSCAFPVIPLALMFTFSMESPVWLRQKGRLAAAQKSSTYFYKDPERVMSSPRGENAKGLGILARLKILFTKPAGVKPLLLMNTMFFLQQLVGIYIVIFFAVTFLQEAGSDMNPYVVTILIGAVRFVFCTATSVIMAHCGRRPLMIGSSIGMAVCMGVSGYATLRVQSGEFVPSWVVPMALLLYVATGCLGLQIIPWAMMAEVFPHDVRSVAQAFNMATAHCMMFSVLQLYPTLSDLLHGSTGVQFMFAVVSLFAAVFVWVFLPETRGKSLAEIEEYFQHNITSFGQKKKQLKLQQQQQPETAAA